jgi:tetratricopeptide (TPR) repeat protein
VSQVTDLKRILEINIKVQHGIDMDRPPPNFDKALATQADDNAVWVARGDALARLGRYTEALACFDQALEIDSSDDAAWVFRGVVLIHLARYQEALLSCDRALRVQPNQSEAWIFKGAALYYLDRYQEAYVCYDRALGVQRRSPWQPFVQALQKICTWFTSC